jgi:hypothetical protein
MSLDMTGDLTRDRTRDRTLPADYAPLPFQGGRGIPQTVPYDSGGLHLRVTIVASATDLPALRSLAATEVLFDGRAEETRRPDGVPADARAWLVQPPPHTLSPPVLRPQLVVSDGTSTLGTRPILVGTPLAVGTTAESPLVVEVLFVSLVLSVGTLTQPGELGGVIVAGIRVRNQGVARYESAPATASTTEEIYASLV